MLPMCPVIWRERRGADPRQEQSLAHPVLPRPHHSPSCRRGHIPGSSTPSVPQLSAAAELPAARASGHSLGSVPSQKKENVNAETGKQLHVIFPVMGPAPAESKGKEGAAALRALMGALRTVRVPLLPHG